MQAKAGVLPEGVISEWRPTRVTLLGWMIAQVPIVAIGLAAYAFVALRGQIPNSWSVDSNHLILVLALVVGLGAVHEAVHGIVMFAFGARPQFGILKIGGILAGFYTTAPGHRFTRRQYLVVGLAPLVVLAPVGIPACLLPFGIYLAFAFAVHLAGCIGDLTIVLHVLRAPSDVLVEDLRDGMRFWKPDA